MSDRFDQIRAAHPTLAISLYGLTPGGQVTLEVMAPDEFRRLYHADTAAECLDLAFPPEPDPAPPEPDDLFA